MVVQFLRPRFALGSPAYEHLLLELRPASHGRRKEACEGGRDAARAGQETEAGAEGDGDVILNIACVLGGIVIGLVVGFLMGSARQDDDDRNQRRPLHPYRYKGEYYDPY